MHSNNVLHPLLRIMLSLLKNSNRTERILVTLKALNDDSLQVTLVDEEPEFIYQKDDVKLADSYSVLKTLASNSQLYGLLDEEKKKSVEEWLEFCKTLEVPVSVLVWLANGLLSHETVNMLAEKKARADIMQLLRQLEVRLKDSPYLAGEECSIADIAVASCLRPLFVSVFGEMERKNSPSMSAWVQKLYTSPMFVDAVGETVLLVSNKKGKKKN
ncbi:hypothetical protein WA588_004369 [Blastocystis sp. NMH]